MVAGPSIAQVPQPNGPPDVPKTVYSRHCPPKVRSEHCMGNLKAKPPCRRILSVWINKHLSYSEFRKMFVASALSLGIIVLSDDCMMLQGKPLPPLFANARW